jgi:mono/diheme cytochrome c family protein/cytochrome bd-type quinol oxidase subunit 1
VNYPVWQLPFPGGILIALVAVAHVFVSHFAIGGGAFLVVSERLAYARGDAALLAYVRRHSRFFALLTLVFGAVSGVGIWFTIGLVSPEATSSLIHTFVWGWAIEWVFFFVEITAAIIYAKSWDKLPAGDHMIVGWIYFVAAWLSLAVINGIITFMLTPGSWLKSHRFLDGFFNPTYFPSLLLRTAICILLAGAFGLITAAREREGRERIVRWASQWLLAGTLLLPPTAAWYYYSIPGFSQKYLSGMLVTAQHVARGGIAFATLALLLALVCGVWKPRLMRLPVIVVLLTSGLGIIGSMEYLREFVRKPWAINGYIYANDVRAASVDYYRQAGMLHGAKFLASQDPNSLAYGRDVFQAQCGRCHSPNGYRAMAPRVRGWDARFAADMLTHIEMTRGAMPRFAGDQQDRAALGRYLASLNPAAGPGLAPDGRQVFETRCGSCHTVNGRFRPLSNALAGAAAEQIEALLPGLDSMSANMPPFSAPPEQAKTLAAYLASALASAHSAPASEASAGAAASETAKEGR